MVERAKGLVRAPLASALLGGLVVALLGWVAIAAGLVASPAEPEASSRPPTPTPIATDAAEAEQGLVARIYERDAGGVAFVEADRPAPAPRFGPFGLPPGGGSSSGSGFVIDEQGHALTNNHVVAGAEAVHVKLGPDETFYDAEVVGRDPATDLALLDVEAPASTLQPLALGDSSQARVGDPVVAIGNPFGLDQTVTAGIVSALQRQIEAPNGFAISDVIQTDASINPGNSGGPLINASGEVIGITSQIETGGGGGSVGIGFAIPSNTAREVVAELKEDGEASHAFLGVAGTTITPELAAALDIEVDAGALVEVAVDGGPADRAGIRGGTAAGAIEGTGVRLGGDVIVRIDGRRIESMDEVVSLVNGSEPGDELEVTVRRGERERALTVTLGERPG